MTPRLPGAPSAPRLDLPPVVLMVDDEPILRELLKEVLESDGFRVMTAADGHEGLRLAELSMPDVLVTDVAMPRLDGFGLIRAVHRLYPGLPVIVLSADPYYDGHPLDEVAARHGVVATLKKPFDLKVLEEAVRSAVPLLQPAALDGDRGRSGRAA